MTKCLSSINKTIRVCEEEQHWVRIFSRRSSRLVFGIGICLLSIPMMIKYQRSACIYISKRGPRGFVFQQWHVFYGWMDRRWRITNKQYNDWQILFYDQISYKKFMFIKISLRNTTIVWRVSTYPQSGTVPRFVSIRSRSHWFISPLYWFWSQLCGGSTLFE